MKKVSIILGIVCFGLFPVCGASTVRANPTSCLVCHNLFSGKIALSSGQVVDLRVDNEKYQTSVHGFLSCTDCHQKFNENPHVRPSEKVSGKIRDISLRIGHKAKVDPVAYGACYNCHEAVYGNVLSSVHGANITKKNERDGALCLDCHGSPHYIVKSNNTDSMVNRWNVVETCGSCHGKETINDKYNLESNVLTSYTESFHGKKHHLGHRRAPTCVSCHGYHDIKGKDDPSSPISASNKTGTCGKCHKGANKKFVAAITHKPVGPIPHYAEKLLIVLTLSVFAFIISHVLLEAYSDIRDAAFRKKRRSLEDGAGKECV